MRVLWRWINQTRVAKHILVSVVTLVVVEGFMFSDCQLVHQSYRPGSHWAHKTCFANHDEISLKCLVGEDDNIKIFYIQKVKGEVCREVDLNSKSIVS